jgi:hypothetical protein
MSRTITATKEQAERGNARDSDEELLDLSSSADENGRQSRPPVPVPSLVVLSIGCCS